MGKRRLLGMVLMLLVASPISFASTAPNSRVVLSQATGDITALGPARITVGHLGCAIRHRVSGLGRFVVSDPVSITCRNGVLNAIVYRSSTIAQSQVTGSSGGLDYSAPPASASTPKCGGSATSFSVGSSGASASGSTCGPDGTTTAWVSTNAHGTISSFDVTSPDGCPAPAIGSRLVPGCASITVGGLTCLIDSTFYTLIAPKYNVGDTASIACNNAKLIVIGH
jgi:hypothetical protein